MKNIVVFGGGDQAKMIRSICRSASSFEIKYYITHEASTKSDFLQFDIWLDKYAQEFNRGIVAIGDNFTRRKVVEQIRAVHKNFEFVTLVHPSAVIDPSVQIAGGTVIMAGAVINPDSKIAEHVVVNTGVIIEHDCSLESFSTAAPGCIMGGHVTVGANSFIGLGAKIIQQKSIGQNTVIGAGSVVVDDIASNMLAYGNPCKVIRQRECHEKYL